MLENKANRKCVSSQGSQNSQINATSGCSSQKKKEIYQCSCDKVYQSFEAIYLHFKQKHNIRLKSQNMEPRKKVIQEANTRICFYDYAQKIGSEEGEENKSLFQHFEHPKTRQKIHFSKEQREILRQYERLPEVILKFLKINNFENEQFFNILINYILEVIKQEEDGYKWDINTQNLVQFLPHYMISYLPQIVPRAKTFSYNWKKYIPSLLSFTKWLREEHQTELIFISDIQ